MTTSKRQTYGISVQVPPEAHERLKEMAAKHPRIRMTPAGTPEAAGAGVTQSEMVGICIDWAWEAIIEDQRMRPGR